MKLSLRVKIFCLAQIPNLKLGLRDTLMGKLIHCSPVVVRHVH